jgi:DNA-binding transcriptional LysR family regulator
VPANAGVCPSVFSVNAEGARALASQGLAWRSAWEVSEAIAKGRLVEVLPKSSAPGNDIYAMYPDREFFAREGETVYRLYEVDIWRSALLGAEEVGRA